MAYKRVILSQAQIEYKEIVSYLTTILKSPQAARNFIDEFTRQIDMICENPDLFGLSRIPELAAHGYRPIFVNNYVALIVIKEETVYVAHVFHQTQDYVNLV